MLAKFEGLKSPTFDDYISDLAILFETYPSKTIGDINNVRQALDLIDELEKVANKMPQVPRDKDMKNDE